MVFLIAILPGVCEELAFRGTLLYGLRGRFHPVALSVVAGIVFGLFHFSYFRIVTTAFLGVVLTAIALVTGSVFPGIALHIGNNAFAYILAEAGIADGDPGRLLYSAATLVFIICLYVIYRYGMERK
jgi:sodium transport system permease protein